MLNKKELDIRRQESFLSLLVTYVHVDFLGGFQLFPYAF